MANDIKEITEVYKKPCDIMYHIFADSLDEYTSDKIEAFIVARNFVGITGNVRIYEKTEWDSEDGVFADGDCIFSVGSFPM